MVDLGKSASTIMILYCLKAVLRAALSAALRAALSAFLLFLNAVCYFMLFDPFVNKVFHDCNHLFYFHLYYILSFVFDAFKDMFLLVLLIHIFTLPL